MLLRSLWEQTAEQAEVEARNILELERRLSLVGGHVLYCSLPSLHTNNVLIFTTLTQSNMSTSVLCKCLCKDVDHKINSYAIVYLTEISLQGVLLT